MLICNEYVLIEEVQTMLPEMLFLSSLLFSGLLAGMFGMGTVVIQPVSISLPTEAHILFRQRMIPRLHYLAPPAMLGSLLSSLSVAIFFTSGWSRALLLLNAGLYCASILITLLGNVPLNHQFMKWKPSTLPENWMNLVHRWGVYDQVRFALCLLAFLSALIAASLTGLR
jgi:Domain of unknown function (DUF1772)